MGDANGKDGPAEVSLGNGSGNATSGLQLSTSLDLYDKQWKTWQKLFWIIKIDASASLDKTVVFLKMDWPSTQSCKHDIYKPPRLLVGKAWWVDVSICGKWYWNIANNYKEITGQKWSIVRLIVTSIRCVWFPQGNGYSYQYNHGSWWSATGNQE